MGSDSDMRCYSPDLSNSFKSSKFRETSWKPCGRSIKSIERSLYSSKAY
jgi:hypothetical protein